jgi:hypothetical protein
MNPLVLLMLLITSSLDPLAVGMLNGTELNQIKQKIKKDSRQIIPAPTNWSSDQLLHPQGKEQTF